MDPLDSDPLERDLRDLLTDGRLALPTHWVGLDRVHAGATRRRRRRAAAVSVAGALVVAAVAGSAVLAHPDRLGGRPSGTAASTGDHTGQPTGTPSGSTATTPLPDVVGPAWDGASVTSVTATSTRTLVVVGRSSSCEPTCLRMAESHDGGATWSALPVPADAPSVDDAEGLRDDTAAYARFGSGEDGWLFGGGLWATHDGGFTWTHLDVPGGVHRLEAAAGTVWALLDVGNRHEQLWSSPVGTDGWQRVKDVEVDGPADLAVQGDRVVVVGANRSAAWSNVSGTFATLDNPCAGSVQVRLSGSGSLWATCVTGMASHVVTSPDGTSWTTVPLSETTGALSNNALVGARSSGEALLWVPDEGLSRLAPDGTLTPVVDGPTAPNPATGFSYLGFTTKAIGYAIRGPDLWRTDDGGDSWRRLDVSTP